jgi:hypothetical protein
MNIHLMNHVENKYIVGRGRERERGGSIPGYIVLCIKYDE